ncbi:uncharacterized protein A1O5_00619 [Cladophialophora psammophila CBS 110553]|uniref:Uncharacterized protein n=1 Tax=Cladophialophora psammophila CBS 110553 TaxID=1182543 RepID=W9XGN1_9EURO|nr:uncharacterized protein A1O5_00619 [Cladophialophora psammophila CBS 110553]EXJ76111.1 hypothetical protein A1O5_00619 [Cladophialophora psammophila CBS 110553]
MSHAQTGCASTIGGTASSSLRCPLSSYDSLTVGFPRINFATVIAAPRSCRGHMNTFGTDCAGRRAQGFAMDWAYRKNTGTRWARRGNMHIWSRTGAIPPRRIAAVSSAATATGGKRIASTVPCIVLCAWRSI